jgi:hypothetical protein
MAGDGTKDSPYLPLTAKHWNSLASLVVGKTSPVYVKLSKNIDLSGAYTPIGTPEKPANVVLDGAGFSLTGLSIASAISGVTSYGLFGGLSGVVKNLAISGEIAVTAPSGASYYGLLAGYAQNVNVLGVKVSGSIVIGHDSKVTDDTAYAGGFIGRVISEGYFGSVEECTSNAEVDVSATTSGVAGGLVGGFAFTYSNAGISTINNCVVSAKAIKGSLAAGGALGAGSYYSSIVNTVVSVTSVSATATSGASAGGIVGAMGYETAVLNNIAIVDMVTGGEKTSDVGDIIGFAMSDDYANGYGQTKGTALFNNVAKGATLTGTTSTAIETSAKVTVETLLATKLAAMNFTTNVWTLTDHSLPQFKSEGVNVRVDATLTFLVNNGTDAKETLAINEGSYPGEYKVAGTYAKHVFVDAYYDAQCTADYRWYAPINGSVTLYDAWYDGTKLAGFYSGALAANGVLVFSPDGTLAWLQTDNYSAAGTWWCDGTNLVFNTDFYEDEVATVSSEGVIKFFDPNDEETEYTFTKHDEFFGYWKNDSGASLMLAGDGTGYYNDGDTTTALTYTKKTGGFVTVAAFGQWSAFDVTKTDDTITFTLNDGDSTTLNMTMTSYSGVPDYSKKAFVGSFNSSVVDSDGKSVSIKLLANGNVQIFKSGSTSVYGYGGYRASDGTITIKSSSSSFVAGDFKWDATKKILVKSDGSVVYSMTGTFSKSYATTDGTVRIFVFSDATYLVMNGKLSSTAITGTLSDGSTITIGADEYTISGTTLTKKAAVDYSVLVNTYEMYIGTSTTASTNVLTLAADKTGTYNGTAITYTFDGKAVSFTYNSVLTFALTWDGTAKTLTGTMDDGDTTTDVTFKVKTVTPVATKNMVGSFSGTVTSGGNAGIAAVVTIAEGGTLTVKIGDYDAKSGTWTGDKTTSITVTLPEFDDDYNDESGTITYDSATDSITLALSGAFTVTGTIARKSA